jgi:hypothetical protein
MQNIEILKETIEKYGYSIDPMHWEDGTVSYGILNKNGKPAFPIDIKLKKDIEQNVPNFSHFGMGDVVHLINNFQGEAIR